MLLVARARTDYSPRWLISNGETVVGPVDTELLVRGVSLGRVPEHCWVRDEHSENWRTLEQVREVRALRSPADAEQLSPWREAQKALSCARDEGELFLFFLLGAARATRSTLGAVHRVRAPVDLPVMSSVFGVPDERLGEVIPETDPLLRLARTGETVLGSPEQGFLESYVAERLAPGKKLGAVIMAPVLYGTELIALLELGREQHSYRRADAEALQRLAVFVAERLEELSW